jgi:ADP-ribosyl-[dinitrogen reductase] hydrolase
MKISPVLGAVVGDVLGSAYEFNSTKEYDFELFHSKAHFTDDTVLTMSVALSILEPSDYEKNLLNFYLNYQGCMYGPGFLRWVNTNQTQDSFGNGAPMRISPIATLFHSASEVLEESKKAVEMTHSHPEGIKGAQAIAMAIHLASNHKSKQEIKDYLVATFGYHLDFQLNDIREKNTFDATSQVTVPQALNCFFESTDFESAIRLAVSLGGDSDTLASMTGGIAAAFYQHIPQDMIDFCMAKLPQEFIAILDRVQNKAS